VDPTSTKALAIVLRSRQVSQKQREEVLLQYFRTSQSVREVMLDIVEGSDLTPDEFVVLSVIGELRAVTPTELAERLGMPPTTISRYAARFVAEGLAVRAVNPSDGRSYFLEVTTQGRAVLSKILPRLRRANQQLAELMDVVAMSSALAHFEEALGTVSNGTHAEV
jgi:DNA-binding MarR family transcriptional regulator